MKHLIPLLLLSGGLLAGTPAAPSGTRTVPASAAALVADANAASTRTGTDASSKLSAGLEVWADLTDVMVRFPASPEAAEIRAGMSGLGSTYGATRKMLAEALAADIFAPNSDSSSSARYELGSNADGLLGTLLRLGLPDRALALIDAADYTQQPSLREAAIDYFVAIGDLPRAKSAAARNVDLLDRVVRRLLATAGPAAALQLLELLTYDKATGLKIASLAAIAHGLDTAGASDADRSAAADALARAKDIASGETSTDPVAIVALAGLGLGEIARRLAATEVDRRRIIPAMLAGGYFAQAMALALKEADEDDTVSDVTTIAAVQAIKGDLGGAEATMARLDRTKVTADQRAIADLRIGKIDDAIALGGSVLAKATWGEILAAVAAKEGYAAAETLAAKHSVNLDDIKEQFALGVGLNDPLAAIATAGDDGKLLLTIADALTTRGNYAGAQLVLTATLSVSAPFDESAYEFKQTIQGRLFDIELKLGEVEAAGARLANLFDTGRLQRFLTAALKAGKFDQAALAVGRMPANTYDNEPTQADGWWQVAEAMAAQQQDPEAARKLLDDKLHIEASDSGSRWIAVLAAAHDRFDLIDSLKQATDADKALRTVIEIAILNLL
ncbi:hypothetical protein HFN49_00020 [Rhizobium leguminosarum]|uniref:hypothetical protein n=1 Tax=Rhizobium ruizarguesonis TaxID=2081791 RepID=UPI001A99DDDA|nr:hypothetical protein [Rhizobium ruizarguesonis]MBY5884586.1 hypothetical protein [Rhizobium leguminosarum]QSZ05151.1 hypothetical protein J3P73_31580 [Rhizobium ruizarguesonis]